ncbi:MAG: hypothetical protein FWF46_08775 [Oscillospiraceae bacterium]|nr:hypothetical protein [Oscillospiraceae bacterium]
MMKTKNQELLIQFIISEVVSFIAEEQDISIEKALEIFYSTEVASKLEDLDTGYYLEGARYIYEIVKEEIN